MAVEREIAQAPARSAGTGQSIPAPLGGLFGFALGLIVLVHYAVPALFLVVILLVEWLR